MSKNSKGLSIFLWMIEILILCGIVFAGVQIYRQLKDYQTSNALYDDLAEQFVTAGDDIDKNTSETEGTGNPNQSIKKKKKSAASENDSESVDDEWDTVLQVDFDSLQEINPDVIGWIWVEDTSINYPLMYSGDNETYLHTSFDGQSATAGAIFVDEYNSKDFTDNHTLIYGHNMRNGSMFGSLDEYYKDESYYQTHSYIQIAAPSGVYRYQIFACQVTDITNPLYTTDYNRTQAYQTLLREIRQTSLIDTGREVIDTDRIISLSTCTAGDERFVVHGVLVGER